MGFRRTSDYVDGKQDWLAHGLPYEGEADLIGRHVEEVPTCRMDTPAREAGEGLGDADVGICIVTNDEGVVFGAVRRSDAEGAGDRPAGEIMVSVSTLRPAVPVEEARHFLTHRDRRFAVVSRSDGVLLGVVRRTKLGDA